MVKATFTTEIPEEEQETTIDKWDWNAVKNALDDSARKFLVAQTGFSESHALMNGRLLISTIAVLFSGYAILHDWYHPFPESRYVLICCVALYFIAMAILTLYTSFLEKGCFAAAKQVDSSGQNKANHWKLSSKQKNRYDHFYVLEIDLYDGNARKTRQTVHETSIAKYFDENGVLCTKPFYNDLLRFFTAIANAEEKKSK